jgi:peptide deformylase
MQVNFTDIEGEKKEMVADGLIAAIVQHECDHLQGKVFIDKVTDKSTLIHESEFEKRYDAAKEHGTFRMTK